MFNKALAISIFAVCAATATTVSAQDDYPKHPIRIITGSAAGSGSDILARYIGSKISTLLGQPIIVDNKAGAAGIIGTAYVAKEKPDGYTLTLGGASTHLLSAALYPKLQYDPVKDFETIGQIGTAGILLIANKNFPANNLTELIALAKAKPGQVQYASWGNGSTGQFCGEVLKQLAGIDMQHIPYKSIPQVTTDVEGGHVGIGFTDITSSTPFVQSGKIKALATCGSASPSLPSVKTYKEQGLDFNRNFRWGLYAPQGTSKPVVDKLANTLKTVLAQADVIERLKGFGITAEFTPGNELAAVTAADITAWKQVVKAAGISASN